MWFQARRFWVDLGRVRGWVLTSAFFVFFLSVMCTYLLAFTVGSARGGLLTLSEDGSTPQSFLRVVDPDESIAHAGTGDSVLEQPAITTLLDIMAENDDLTLTLPLSAISIPFGSQLAHTNAAGTVIVNTEHSPSAGVHLWGSLSDAFEGVPGINDTTLGSVPVHQESVTPLTGTFVGGNARVTELGEGPALFLHPHTLQRFVVEPPFKVSDVVNGITCVCKSPDLVRVAHSMSEAERGSTNERLYFAAERGDIVGAVQHSRAVTEALTAAHGAGTLLAVICFMVLAARVFWLRNRVAYLAEQHFGSPQLPHQIRQQLIIALAVTIPLLLGFELVAMLLRDSASPPPLPQNAQLVAFVAAFVLHVSAGISPYISIHRLHQPRALKGTR